MADTMSSGWIGLGCFCGLIVLKVIVDTSLAQLEPRVKPQVMLEPFFFFRRVFKVSLKGRAVISG